MGKDFNADLTVIRIIFSIDYNFSVLPLNTLQIYLWLPCQFTSDNNTNFPVNTMKTYQHHNTHLPVIIMQTVNTRKHPENNPTRNVVHGFCWNKNKAFFMYMILFFDIIFIVFQPFKNDSIVVNPYTWKWEFLLCEVHVFMFPSISYMY